MKAALLAKQIVYSGIMGGILIAVQVAMAGLPNIELVSLLVMLYTLYDAKLARRAIAVFVLLQGLLYGFHLWWLSYLYIWYVLHFTTLATRRYAGVLFNALLSALFGLGFGALTSIPYFFAAGPAGGLAYIIAGFPFDVPHCIGNFVLALALFAPLRRLFVHLPRPGGPPKKDA